MKKNIISLINNKEILKEFNLISQEAGFRQMTNFVNEDELWECLNKNIGNPLIVIYLDYLHLNSFSILIKKLYLINKTILLIIDDGTEIIIRTKFSKIISDNYLKFPFKNEYAILKLKMLSLNDELEIDEKHSFIDKININQVQSVVSESFFILDKRGVLVDFKRNFGSELYFDVGNYLHKSIFSFLPYSIAEDIHKSIKKSISSSHVQFISFKITINDELNYFEGRIAKLDAERVIATVKNVTFDKIMELSYSNLLDSNFQGIVIIKQNKVYFINQYGSDILGYDELELKKMPLSKLENIIYLEDQNKYNFFDVSQYQNNKDKFNIRIVRKDKNIRWIEVFTQKIFVLGEVVLQIVFSDITSKINNEEELLQIKKNIENIINNTDDMIWSLDKNYNLLYFNKNFKRNYILGYKYYPEIGESIFVKQKPEEVAFWKTRYNKALSGEKFSEKISYSFNKKIQHYQVFFNPSFDDNNQVCGVVIRSQNITDQVKIEETLKEERDLFLSGPAILFKWNSIIERKVEFVSDNIKKILGYETDVFYQNNLNFNDIIHPDDKEWIKSLIKKAKEHQETLCELPNYRIKNKNGDFVWINETLNFVKDDSGDLKHILGFVIINSQNSKFTNDLLVKHHKQIEQDNFKKEFLSKMSHELRTPLNAILGISQVLESKFDDDTKVYLKSIISSSKILLSHINDLIYISGNENSELKVDKNDINIREMFLLIKQTLMAKNNKNLDFIVEISHEVPDCIITDETRLRQIVNQLVENAYQYTDSGFIKIFVFAENVREQELDLKINVIDTSPGIPEELKREVSENFNDNNIESIFKASGFGLAFVKNILLKMGGNLYLKNTSPKGVTFQIALNNVQYKKCVGDDESCLYDIVFKKSNVLLFDDNEINKFIIQGMLQSSSVNIILVKDKEDFYYYLDQYSIDLILIDIIIPNTDCLQVVSQLKSNLKTKKIPVIAYTGVSKDKLKKHYYSLFDDYLLKPVLANDLIAVLKKYLPFSYEEKSKIETGLKEENYLFKGKELAKSIDHLYEIKQKVESEILPIWENISEVLLIDDVEVFYEKLKIIATEYKLENIINYCNDLKEKIIEYDVQNIHKMLKTFEKIYDSLRS